MLRAVTFIPNPAGIAYTFHSVEGPVGRDILKRTVKVHALARQLCPVNTGRLRQSIRFAVATLGTTVIGTVGTDVNYAAFVEGGTRPHTIRPRTKQALFWKGADHPVASVNHPGTRAHPFLRNSLLAARG